MSLSPEDRIPGLRSAWAKFDRANEHLEILETTVHRIMEQHPGGIGFNVETEVGGREAVYLYRVRDIPVFGENVSCLLGDTIQNYRAALDHLAWRLVKVGVDSRPKRPELVKFPIITRSAKDFLKKTETALPGVAAEHIALIKRYQPYRRNQRSRAVGRLQTLSNRDKHKIIVPTVLAPHKANITIRVSPGSVITHHEKLFIGGRPLKVGAKWLRVYVTWGNVGSEMELEGQYSVYPSLGYRVPLVASMKEIRRTVLELLTDFNSRL